MVCHQFELVSWMYFVDQQKSTCVFYVSYASFITTLLTTDYGSFVAC